MKAGHLELLLLMLVCVTDVGWWGGGALFEYFHNLLGNLAHD